MSARHARPLSRRGRRSWAEVRAGGGVGVGVGDLIIVGSATPEGPTREGVIVEVQNGNGSPPYVVIWSDTRERALLYPGGDMSIRRAARSV